MFSQNGLLTTVASRIAGVQQFAVEGSIFIAGAAVQWLRDGLGIIKTRRRERTARRERADERRGVRRAGVRRARRAALGHVRPRHDRRHHARHDAAHIARATLESIALQTLDVVELMERETGVKMRELRVDGGAAANNLLMQMQADVLGMRVVRSATAETTALGAAYFAGLATGFWRDQQELRSIWRAGGAFEPRMAASERIAMIAGWRRAVERAKGWAA